MKQLERNFNRVVLIAGSDRVKEFESVLNKYNGKEYNFDEIKVVSAGARDPDADDVTGMSASKMRQAAVDGDVKTIKSGLPDSVKRDDDFVEMYIDTVLSGMS